MKKTIFAYSMLFVFMVSCKSSNSIKYYEKDGIFRIYRPTQSINEGSKNRKIDNVDIKFEFVNFKGDDEKNENKLFSIIYCNLDNSKYDLLETMYALKMHAVQIAENSNLLEEKKIEHNELNGYEFITSHANGKAFSKNWYLTDENKFIFILQVVTDSKSNLNNQEMNHFLESFELLRN